ncbi:hypothetical protein NP233_g5343 [Leucocoprinus birnbaumii]|uniref:Uncharacterized protein n=1 Tax=Leucocoprinus birnbaumii TaxID=56174 RepID=A0AAD5VT19_9AGAR|nr:hypothetical protein NP233_g5343 [Leucocoprinus birnbaumii]
MSSFDSQTPMVKHAAPSEGVAELIQLNGLSFNDSYELSLDSLTDEFLATVDSSSVDKTYLHSLASGTIDPADITQTLAYFDLGHSLLQNLVDDFCNAGMNHVGNECVATATHFIPKGRSGVINPNNDSKLKFILINGSHHSNVAKETGITHFPTHIYHPALLTAHSQTIHNLLDGYNTLHKILPLTPTTGLLHALHNIATWHKHDPKYTQQQWEHHIKAQFSTCGLKKPLPWSYAVLHPGFIDFLLEIWERDLIVPLPSAIGGDSPDPFPGLVAYLFVPPIVPTLISSVIMDLQAECDYMSKNRSHKKFQSLLEFACVSITGGGSNNTKNNACQLSLWTEVQGNIVDWGDLSAQTLIKGLFTIPKNLPAGGKQQTDYVLLPCFIRDAYKKTPPCAVTFFKHINRTYSFLVYLLWDRIIFKDQKTYKQKINHIYPLLS